MHIEFLEIQSSLTLQSTVYTLSLIHYIVCFLLIKILVWWNKWMYGNNKIHSISYLCLMQLIQLYLNWYHIRFDFEKTNKSKAYTDNNNNTHNFIFNTESMDLIWYVLCMASVLCNVVYIYLRGLFIDIDKILFVLLFYSALFSKWWNKYTAGALLILHFIYFFKADIVTYILECIQI